MEDFLRNIKIGLGSSHKNAPGTGCDVQDDFVIPDGRGDGTVTTLKGLGELLRVKLNDKDRG